MQRSVIETIMGAVVLAVAALFLSLAYRATDLAGQGGGYSLVGHFTAVDGLTLGSDVRLGGVKVGTVTDQYIDQELFEAVVKLSIEEGVKLPTDSSAQIASDGLLGGRFVSLVPGTDAAMLEDGAEIVDTRDAVALEDLLGRAIFLIADE